MRGYFRGPISFARTVKRAYLEKVKILLVNPLTPDTFWSFKHAVRFVMRKASMAPLGLLTVAGMLPPDWELKLVDLNVRPLRDDDP